MCVLAHSTGCVQTARKCPSGVGWGVRAGALGLAPRPRKLGDSTDCVRPAPPPPPPQAFPFQQKALTAMFHDNRTTSDVAKATRFPAVEPAWHPTEKMKALVFRGADMKLEVTTMPRPVITEAGDVIVKVTATTVCGSDLHLAHNEVQHVEDGDVLGHEAVGIIVEAGPGVTKFKGEAATVACADRLACRSLHTLPRSPPPSHARCRCGCGYLQLVIVWWCPLSSPVVIVRIVVGANTHAVIPLTLILLGLWKSYMGIVYLVCLDTLICWVVTLVVRPSMCGCPSLTSTSMPHHHHSLMN